MSRRSVSLALHLSVCGGQGHTLSAASVQCLLPGTGTVWSGIKLQLACLLLAECLSSPPTERERTGTSMY